MAQTKSPVLPHPGTAQCGICGEIHQHCAQHKNGTNLPCGKDPRRGEKFCRFHGGNLPKVRAKAEAYMQEMKVRALAQTLGLPVDVDPHTAILNEIHWSAGHVEFYRAQVQLLAPGVLIQGVRGITQSTKTGFQAGESIEKEVGPDVHVWLKLYGEERDRLARLCLGAMKAGIDERRIQVEEQQASMLAQGLMWLQTEVKLRLDLNAVESKVFGEVLGEMLRRLDTMEAEVGATET